MYNSKQIDCERCIFSKFNLFAFHLLLPYDVERSYQSCVSERSEIIPIIETNESQKCLFLHFHKKKEKKRKRKVDGVT